MSSIVSERKSKSREVSSHVASASALVSPAAPEHVAPPSTAPAPVVRSPLRAVSVWVTLLVFWLLLSGMYTPFLLAAGAVAAAAVTAIALRMGLIDREGHPIDLGIRAFCWYWPWLVKEIVKSAWQVTRIILHPKLPISPRVVRFEPSQKSDLGLVIHANSITLTPGTICIEATRGEFLVHALTADGAESQVTGNDMDRRVASLEGR